MADDSFPVDEAQIVALFMESVFYGIYLVTLAQCLRALLWSPLENKFKSRLNWPMLVVTILLAVFATLDVAFGLRHLLDAFIFWKGPGGAIEELNNISYWVNVMKTGDYVAQTFIGDAMLIYRCWLVYGKDWRVIVPSMLLWLGGSTCGILLTVTFATLKTNALIDTSKAVPFVDSMIALTLSMNIITTSLIVYKIWSVKRMTNIISGSTSSSSRRPSRLGNAMVILVESAAMYTISVIVFVATYIAGNNANYGTSDNVVQIIGISFNLIIIRVDSGNSFTSTKYTNASISNLKANITPNRKRGQAETYPLSILQTEGDIQPSSGAVEIEISKETHQDMFLQDQKQTFAV